MKALLLFSASLCLWGKRILLRPKRLAKNDQSEPNLIEAWLIRCWGAFYLQGTDSASVSFLAQIITQVWRRLEDVVRWGLEVWSGDSVPWKDQIFEWNLNGMPYWDWTYFWVHEMDNLTFGSWSTRNWKDIVLHPKYLGVCVAFPHPKLEGCWIHSSFLAHCWQWLTAAPRWLLRNLHEMSGWAPKSPHCCI